MICVGFDCWGLVVDFLVFVLELVLAFVCLSVWVWWCLWVHLLLEFRLLG